MSIVYCSDFLLLPLIDDIVLFALLIVRDCVIVLIVYCYHVIVYHSELSTALHVIVYC